MSTMEHDPKPPALEPLKINDQLSPEVLLSLALMDTTQIAYDLATVAHVRDRTTRDVKLAGIVAGCERISQRLKAVING